MSTKRIINNNARITKIQQKIVKECISNNETFREQCQNLDDTAQRMQVFRNSSQFPSLRLTSQGKAMLTAIFDYYDFKFNTVNQTTNGTVLSYFVYIHLDKYMVTPYFISDAGLGITFFSEIDATQYKLCGEDLGKFVDQLGR